jgi:hypothetical protein
MRFPPYPTDILTRADALLSSKYPDGIVDPAIAILVCKMAVEERERCLSIAEGMLRFADTTSASDEATAKAIRGTE